MTGARSFLSTNKRQRHHQLVTVIGELVPGAIVVPVAVSVPVTVCAPVLTNTMVCCKVPFTNEASFGVMASLLVVR